MSTELYYHLWQCVAPGRIFMLRKQRHRAPNGKKLQFKPGLYSAPHNLALSRDQEGQGTSSNLNNKRAQLAQARVSQLLQTFGVILHVSALSLPFHVPQWRIFQGKWPGGAHTHHTWLAAHLSCSHLNNLWAFPRQGLLCPLERGSCLLPSSRVGRFNL